MRPRPNPRVLAWAEALPGMALSVITLEELWYGLSLKPSARMESWLRSFLDENCEILPVSEAVARRCAMLRAGFRHGGRPRTQADMLIAATAWEHRLTLATRNLSDFAGCGIPVLDPFARG